MGLPHALVLPYPAQGHVIPLLELSYCLVDEGFKITFVNTECNHNLVLANLSKESEMKGINLVAVPDGADPGDDRRNLGMIAIGIQKVMPICLEELIRMSNEPGNDKITCMIVDQTMAWALEVAKKMGLRAAAFWPASAGSLLATLRIPKLIEDGIIDAEGTPKKQQTFQLDSDMPPMNASYLAWTCFADPELRKIIFDFLVKNNRATWIAERIICNSFKEIELPVFNHAPEIIPVGPLLTGERFGKPTGHFWPEDTTCMAWLDEQAANSVIYVAFGSFTIFDQIQFQELALGLDLSGRTFLWVVRPDLTSETSDAYPEGFRERVMTRGRMVGWAPQQKVLAHPSIACFLSHCGWNSTLEGVRNGVPFLCWPYFADQLLNRSYICDVWRTGLQMIANESGIITKEHIKSRVEELLGDEAMRARALELRETAKRSVMEGGTSIENLKSFIDAMK